jgi:threonine aldolase
MTIDLRSDTVTRPSAGMRRAIAEAEVGDDDRDGDPTVRRLEERVAQMLGKDRALFFPTGTMANQTAISVLSRPGTEMLVETGAHIVDLEMAGAALLSGVQIRVMTPTGPVLRASDLESAFRPHSRDVPEPSLVTIENTRNSAGGKITPLGNMRALHAAATRRALPVHLDGARLWNASVASGTSLAEFAACAETVMVSFSKGLGAPVGAALAGKTAAIDAAWIVRRRLGGAMRQSGILAAAALYGLDHNLARLADDHERARELAAAVDGAGGAAVVRPDTNIIMVDLAPAMRSADVVRLAKEQDVLVAAWTPTRLRVVTHLDVTAADVQRASTILASVLESLAASGTAPPHS